jgi:F5/8 type C domain
MTDGRFDTSWEDQPQRPGQWVQVDLGAVRDVAAVTEALGRFAMDFPRRLAIDVSIDGTAWDTVWEGTTAAYAFRASVVEPRAAEMQFTFATRQARFVRLRQLATHANAWRIAEIQVHAPAAR